MLPGVLETGTYYYGVCITPVEGESDTTNNCSEPLAIEFVKGDENLPLQIRGQILKREFDVGGDAEVFDVGRYFTRKTETYTASSADETIATAVMSGSEVTLTPIAEGWTIIRITAQDDEELAEQTFIVAVGDVEGPLLAPIGTIPLQTLDVGVPPVVLPVRGYFAGEVQEWTVSSGDAEIVTAEISGGAVSLSPISIGQTTVTVEASRGDLRAKQSFSVVVRPDTSPEVSIPDFALREAIRWSLDLAEGTPLTEQKMRQLTHLETSQFIYGPSVDPLALIVVDLTGLEHAVNLTELNLRSHGIVDISAIGNLTKLRKLDLVDNPIVDISAVSNLTNLTHLWIGGDIFFGTNLKISDISAVRNLTNLTILSVGGNGIVDISAVGNLTNLTVLNLWGDNPIVDISAVRNLTNLTSLYFWGDNDIVDISAVRNLTNLTELYLNENAIVDISAVGNLTKLTELNLDDNQISDISALENLTKLTQLRLRRNLITDVSALENLTNLRRVYLAGNDITDLAPLRSLNEKNPSVQFDINIFAGLAPAAPLFPNETALLPNYPNPSNPETWIPYHLTEPADVTLTIYDLRGVVIRRLAIGHQPAGFYQHPGRAAHWDGRNALGEPVASGVYFYTLIAGDFTATKKLLIRK